MQPDATNTDDFSEPGPTDVTPTKFADVRIEVDGRKTKEVARILWTEILARLTHVADEFTHPEVAARIRGLGVRSMDTALSGIAREYAKASQIALATGGAPLPHEIMRRTRDMSRTFDLRFDLLELVRSYRLLIAELDLPLDSNRYRWLEGRALVHLARANALERDP